eukprot:scaffold271337_cov31-Tisochrysis_lutea.AAC.3
MVERGCARTWDRSRGLPKAERALRSANERLPRDPEACERLQEGRNAPCWGHGDLRRATCFHGGLGRAPECSRELVAARDDSGALKGSRACICD